VNRVSKNRRRLAIVWVRNCPYCPYFDIDRCDHPDGKREYFNVWGVIPDWCPLQQEEVNGE